MDHPTRLETNAGGYYEIRWTERDPTTGRGRTHAVSTRTKDKRLAEEVRLRFVQAEQDEARERAAARGGHVADVLDAYEVAAKARGVGATQGICVSHLRRELGAERLDALTPERLLMYRVSRGVADSTLRRELNTLSAALAWATKHRKIDANTAPVVELPPEGAARAVFLDEKLEHELFALASRDLDGAGRLSRVARFVCLGLGTGARRGAILGLTWDRVDLARGVIDFRDPGVRVTKKRRVSTPIPTRLRPVMDRAFAERKGAHVLDSALPVRAAWGAFMAVHKFEGVTPHVLRHTRITLLLRAGVSVWDVSALVGASPDVIHGVYGHHVADDRLRAQADRRAA